MIVEEEKGKVSGSSDLCQKRKWTAPIECDKFKHRYGELDTVV
jgi:hypothetical protein